jgi:hypothetical protein
LKNETTQGIKMAKQKAGAAVFYKLSGFFALI